MILDVVIDTNVFMHADNVENKNRLDSLALLEALRLGTVQICVDEGAHLNESKNRSQIFGEYRTHLQAGGVGRATVALLAASQRLSMVKKSIPGALAKKIVGLVHDQTDRVFVKVAYNTHEKILVSHDEVAFTKQACKGLKSEAGVKLKTAKAAAKLL